MTRDCVVEPRDYALTASELLADRRARGPVAMPADPAIVQDAEQPGVQIGALLK